MAKFCRNCGAQLNENDTVCAQCGTSVVNASDNNGSNGSTGSNGSNGGNGSNERRRKKNKNFLIALVAIVAIIFVVSRLMKSPSDSSGDEETLADSDSSGYEEVLDKYVTAIQNNDIDTFKELYNSSILESDIKWAVDNSLELEKDFGTLENMKDNWYKLYEIYTYYQTGNEFDGLLEEWCKGDLGETRNAILNDVGHIYRITYEINAEDDIPISKFSKYIIEDVGTFAFSYYEDEYTKKEYRKKSIKALLEDLSIRISLLIRVKEVVSFNLILKAEGSEGTCSYNVYSSNVQNIYNDTSNDRFYLIKDKEGWKIWP